MESPSLPSHTTALIFDLDGTLIDTFHLYLEAYRRALAPFLGFSPSDVDIIAKRPSSERRFLTQWVGEENTDACHEAMCRHYEELHAALGEGLYEGAWEMLAALRAADIPLGIVTGKGRRAWEITAEALDLGSFTVVVTDDDVAYPKPHPDGLLSALTTLEVTPKQAVYIGDSASDLEAGRNAGMRVGAALWPKTAPGERDQFLEQIRPFAPDWHFERPADVVRTFAAWC